MTARARHDRRAVDLALAEAAGLAGQISTLGSFMVYSAGEAPCRSPGSIWAPQGDLCDIAAAPHQRLLAALAREDAGDNRRAISASLLLRHGRASGFLIGSWLVSGQVVHGADLALRFTAGAVLAEIRVRSCAGLLTGGDAEKMRGALVRELVAHTAPIIEAHHRWSGFSRKALWAMALSSWAEQVIHLTELTGDPERGLAEAEALLAIDPDIAAAAPAVYLVRSEDRRAVCQKRALCCLWFKGPKRQFCTSCPIIPDEERLARNHKMAARRGLPDAGVDSDRRIA